MSHSRRDTVVVVTVWREGNGINGRVHYNGPNGPVTKYRRSIEELCDLVRGALERWETRT